MSMPWLSWANSAACSLPVAAAGGCGPSSVKTGGGPGGGGGGGGQGALWTVGESNNVEEAMGPWTEGEKVKPASAAKTPSHFQKVVTILLQ